MSKFSGFWHFWGLYWFFCVHKNLLDCLRYPIFCFVQSVCARQFKSMQIITGSLSTSLDWVEFFLAVLLQWMQNWILLCCWGINFKGLPIDPAPPGLPVQEERSLSNSYTSLLWYRSRNRQIYHVQMSFPKLVSHLQTMHTANIRVLDLLVG